MKNRYLNSIVLIISVIFGSVCFAAEPDTMLVKDDLDLLLLYYAKNGDKVPYEDLTFIIFPQYQKESDAFKRREIVEKNKPVIDKKLAEFKTVSNFYIEAISVGQPMSAYDFNKKGFNVSNPSDPNCLSYFGASMPRAICYKFKNQQNFSFMGVSDIEKAKRLEKMRNTYGSFGNSRVYFRVVDFDESIRPLGKQPIAEITKIVVTNKVGNELYTLQK